MQINVTFVNLSKISACKDLAKFLGEISDFEKYGPGLVKDLAKFLGEISDFEKSGPAIY